MTAMDPAERALAAVLADARGTAADRADIRVLYLDPSDPGVIAQVLPDWRTWIDPKNAAAARVLLKIADNVVAIAEARRDEEGLKAEIASLVQDFVIDETGRPWPVVEHGGSDVVLDVRLGEDACARWAAHGEAVVRVGELHEYPGAAD
jgi:hypothetical protein